MVFLGTWYADKGLNQYEEIRDSAGDLACSPCGCCCRGRRGQAGFARSRLLLATGCRSGKVRDPGRASAKGYRAKETARRAAETTRGEAEAGRQTLIGRRYSAPSSRTFPTMLSITCSTDSLTPLSSG